MSNVQSCVSVQTDTSSNIIRNVKSCSSIDTNRFNQYQINGKNFLETPIIRGFLMAYGNGDELTFLIQKSKMCWEELAIKLSKILKVGSKRNLPELIPSSEYFSNEIGVHASFTNIVIYQHSPQLFIYPEPNNDGFVHKGQIIDLSKFYYVDWVMIQKFQRKSIEGEESTESLTTTIYV